MQQRSSTRSNSSSEYYPSDGHSERSASTAPTYQSPPSSIREYLDRDYPEFNSYDDTKSLSYHDYVYGRTSAETNTSTAPSIDDFDDDLPTFDVPDYQFHTSPPAAIASTPREFAQYFPSANRLSIKHDDTTDDGNMNLRIDTAASIPNGGNIDLTLFHLRMHDLKRREFSLRRHCRDSGKEVCHSSRKYVKPSVIRRPALQRSMSHALSSLRSKSENKTSTLRTLKRQDSGYDSMSEDDDEEIALPQQPRTHNVPRPSNTVMLEFSNYTHLEVKRRGAKSSKRYEFDYWGTKYAWRRVSTRSGNFTEIAYHLFDTAVSRSIAHIVPVPLSNSEARQEEEQGGYAC